MTIARSSVERNIGYRAADLSPFDFNFYFQFFSVWSATNIFGRLGMSIIFTVSLFFLLFFLPRSIASFMQSYIIICSIHESFITIITTARITHVDFVHTMLHKPFAARRFSPVFGKLKRLRCNYFI